MSKHLQQSAARYFSECCGVDWDSLLAPIAADSQAGQSLRQSSVYSAIHQARRQDDASLPMGAWEYELKRADWAQVNRLALEALQNQSKDLQLVAWLLEAQINLRGIYGISACLVLLEQICASYWDTLFPPPEDGHYEHRANIIAWIGEKLLVTLKLSPLIGIDRERQYTWADWEQAHRNEQLKVGVGSKTKLVLEGVSLTELTSAINGTATESFQTLQQALAQALAAIAQLNQTLDQLFGSDAPGIGSMTALLQQMYSLVESELHKRGVRGELANENQAEIDEPEQEDVSVFENDEQALQLTAGVAQTVAAAGAIRNRAEAYARLAETAEFLMRLEPHSPVPYLVRRATEWGRLNTVELYQELFLRLNGQLNIFEMLGLQADQPGQ